LSEHARKFDGSHVVVEFELCAARGDAHRAADQRCCELEHHQEQDGINTYNPSSNTNFLSN